MPEKDLNLEENVDLTDLSSISLDDESLDGVDLADVLEDTTTNEAVAEPSASGSNDLKFEEETQGNGTIDEKVFLDTWDLANRNVLKDWDKFWVYLRWFFFAALVTLFWLLAIALFYSFSVYIKEASKITPDAEKQGYVDSYKSKYSKVKGLLWMDGSYSAPILWASDESQRVNEILNANDIDYIDKKDLLVKYAWDLVRNAEGKATEIETIKQDIAKQWFLPEELETLLSEDQAIDTIQRSLNALEVIKFSTATKVFSYMNTALATISEMMRISWASVENLRDLFVQLSSRWEKDISSYVYMCYLNPFEISADCDTVWDLDLYYRRIVEDDSIDIRLFKNSMSIISQLLEKEDTSLFSITFNWFNAEDKSIKFNIEVFTNQEDERTLMLQGKKNPNIFILTNIINLLKQSSFIIWADINVKEVNVNDRNIDQWSVSRTVHYSTMDFSVPIQKNTEREIFDYIDLDSMRKKLSDGWFAQSKKYTENDTNTIVGKDKTLNLDEESNEDGEIGEPDENDSSVEEWDSEELDTELWTEVDDEDQEIDEED